MLIMITHATTYTNLHRARGGVVCVCWEEGVRETEWIQAGKEKISGAL